MGTGEKSGPQRTALDRTRERTFAEHGITYRGVWLYPEYFKPALAMLKLGIILEGGLVTSSGKKYYIDLRDSVGRPVEEKIDYLLFDLVRAYLDYSSPTDILFHYDQNFWQMAEIAQMGGIQKRRLEGLWEEWREKISKRLVEGKINRKFWLQIIWDGPPPPPLSRELAKTFLRYVPQADAKHIAAWTNSVLIALENKPEKENTLRLYVGKLKKSAAAQPRGPICITE
jgi:hypothetical protein